MNSPSLLTAAVFARVAGIFVVVAAATAIFFGPTDNWMWDPSFYYAQMRTPLIEGNLDMSEDIYPRDVAMPRNKTGLIGSVWPLGPGLLWTPFFLVAHTAKWLTDSNHADGTSPIYIALVSIGSALYGFVGLLFIFKLCRQFASSHLALLITIACFGASALLYYSLRQPIMAHTTSFLCSSALLLTYIYLRKKVIPMRLSGLLLGVLLALNILTRWSGALTAIFPVAFFVTVLWQQMAVRDWKAIRITLFQIAFAAICCVTVFSPQLAFWYKVYGRWFVSPQGVDSFVAGWLPINLPNVLISTNRGLIFWMPLAVFGLIGLCRLSDRPLRALLLAYFAIACVLIGYRVDWYSGAGFGARYFIELLPVIAIGLCALFCHWDLHVVGRWALRFLVFALVAHQLLLMYVYEHAPSNGWVDYLAFGTGQPLGIRFQLDSALKLIWQPILWFQLRPYVGMDRQSLPVALMATPSNLRTLPQIPLIGTLCAPFLAIGAAWMLYKLRSRGATITAAFVIIYCLAWFVFLLSIPTRAV